MNNLGARLRYVRVRSGLSLRELARKVNVSPSFISQIENGKSQPSVATLYAFSQLLNVSVDELFEDRPVPDSGVAAEAAPAAGGREPAAALRNAAGPASAAESRLGIGHNPSSVWQPSEYSNRVSIVHPSHRSSIDMAAGVVWERLASTPERAVNFMRISYAPGASSTDTGEMSSHPGYEYGYVELGALEVTVGGEVFRLHQGESLGFDSSIPHTFRNPGPGVMHGVWFVHGVDLAP
jgi:transcriptional regulator with XRE-family HTH domain/quercetin dioxygenase-like cupin family protein